MGDVAVHPGSEITSISFLSLFPFLPFGEEGNGGGLPVRDSRSGGFWGTVRPTAYFAKATEAKVEDLKFSST